MFKKVQLANGFWIDVKDRLKVRDKEDVHTYSVDGVSSDGLTYRFNVVKHQIATAAVRILNWHLEADGKGIPWPAGKPFKERIAAIRALDEEQFEELHSALVAHLEMNDEAQATAKKETAAGETGSETNSSSVN